MIEHNHSTTSNTDEVFRTFIGCQVKGVLHARNTQGGSIKILVFECSWGLAFNSNGSHWTERPEAVQKIIRTTREALNASNRELKHILSLAGEEDK